MGNGAGKNKDAVREIRPNGDDIVDGNDDYYERLEEQAKKSFNIDTGSQATLLAGASYLG